MNSEYHYDGPVFCFDECMRERWKANTIAPSKQKALSNLSYRYKKKYGLSTTSKIRLTGKITVVEGAQNG